MWVQRATKRTQYHHGDLRAALLRATVSLIQRRGVMAFTIADAAKAAGVAVSAPYRHFADREALLAAVAQQGFDELRARFAAVSSDASGAVRFEEMAVVYVRFANQRRGHFRVMFEGGLDKTKHPELALSGEATFAFLLQAAAELSSRSGKRKRTTTAAALWSMVHGFAVLANDSALAMLAADLPDEELLRGAVRLVLLTLM